MIQTIIRSTDHNTRLTTIISLTVSIISKSGILGETINKNKKAPRKSQGLILNYNLINRLISLTISNYSKSAGLGKTK